MSAVRLALGAARVALYLVAMFGLIYAGDLLDSALGRAFDWSTGRAGTAHFLWLVGLCFAAGACALRCLGARSAELLGSWAIAELALTVAIAGEWSESSFGDAWLAFNIPLGLWPAGAGVGSAALALRARRA